MTPSPWSAAEAVLGLLLMAVGIGMISGPAAFVLVGAVLFGMAVWPRGR